MRYVCDMLTSEVDSRLESLLKRKAMSERETVYSMTEARRRVRLNLER